MCSANYVASAGVLRSLDYPAPYPTDKQCTYTITVPVGQQILLNVSKFALEEDVMCGYDYLEIR